MNQNNDICAQITDLIGDLSGMTAEISQASEKAAIHAAELIRSEQVRIFAKANFKRDKKSHVYKFADPSLVKLYTKRQSKYRVTVSSGYDSQTIKKYPELLIIEFGRPGKSPRHSGLVESREITKNGKKIKKRKKGKFPESSVVMPIRAGYYAARDQAFEKYKNEMFQKAEELFRGGSS